MKGLTQRQRDSLPSSAFVFPKRRAYPIHDFGHGRLALQYAQFNDKRDLERVKEVVFSRYPSLRTWWNKHHPTKSKIRGKGLSRRTSNQRQITKKVANPTY